MATTSGYTKQDFVAVRRGPIYCAPFCGGKCTWAAFQLATQRAEGLCKKLGAGWKPHVHENLGWHASVVGLDGHMRVTINTNGGQMLDYTAYLSPEGSSIPGGRWAESSKTPEAAIRAVRVHHEAALAELQALQEILVKGLGE